MKRKTNPQGPFMLLLKNRAFPPHEFDAWRYCREDRRCWQSVVDGCLDAWRIKAESFYEKTGETGFKRIGLNKILNIHGRKRLPPTPPEDSRVTKNPAITDMSEVLALQALKWKEKNLVTPYPRVLHKESPMLQHRGVDAMGYTKNGDKYTLFLIEVMASAENRHPPATVKDHLKQLLTDTLDAPEHVRLLNDLQTLHDESSDEHRDILNGFIIAACEGSLSSSDSVVAVPVLVRRFEEFDEKDWKPFIRKTVSFEKAAISSKLLFLGIECHKSFSGLLDLIKESAAGVDHREMDEGGN